MQNFTPLSFSAAEKSVTGTTRVFVPGDLDV